MVLGLLGDTRSVQDIAFRSYEGVDTTIRITNTYKLTSREFHPQNTVVDVEGMKIGDGNFITMAGPCSVEGLEQIRQTAQIAKMGGAQILRGGAFKTSNVTLRFSRTGRRGIEILTASG
ncbi:2-keto-3-deoxy-D-arabino-heptulosonate-7-phosphate synthase [Tetragenococcus muriaticus PMC-11-5]|uniref:2-keto-3-deoxy-D-arabino-heptulosonate-7-phosphate synthase n=1 Tax=Tetragenococcus muriaticus PMC-11-5 TaxID=1302649 RepID=A0A091C467_9ENTE|nr:2-keto-3-deoxy-D-arabino-heptulosonate-7-phosphate synthase [Tetragenococcus muriaticus PMC-11-5]